MIRPTDPRSNGRARLARPTALIAPAVALVLAATGAAHAKPNTGPAEATPSPDASAPTGAGVAALPGAPASEAPPVANPPVSVAGGDAVQRGAPAVASCGPAQVRSLSASLAGAFARVEAPGVRGLGIALDDRGHLLTALSIVRVGRGVKVQLWGEESWRDAEIVATDEEHELAVVRVDGTAPASWVRIAERDAQLGDEVVAVTFGVTHGGWDFAKDLVLEPGRVTALPQGQLRASGLDRDHHRIGSPLLDCSGAIVGLATERDSDRSATTGAIRALVASVPSQEGYDGDWSFMHPSLAFVAQLGHRWAPGFEEPDRWFGVRLGGAIIGYDQWFFPLRFGLYGLAGPEPDTKLGDRSGMRVQGEAGFGYRAMLKGGAIPVYLIPQLTAVMSWERTVLEGTDFAVSLSECDPAGTCPVRATPTEVEEELFRVMPAAGVSLGFGRGEIGYQLQIDVEEIDRSVHQISAGVQF